VFFARSQGPDDISFGVPALLIRTGGVAAQHTDAIHAVLQTVQADLPYVMVTPLAESIRSAVLPFRIGATLFSMFSAVALVLACVGLCGVLGYFVTERTPEIGIRRSLGAPMGSVVLLVVRQGIVPVGIGVALGCLTAIAGTRYIQSLLYGTDARDVASFGTASIVLVAVAVLAIAVPAYRAARIDPLVALRSE
jgi:ABC-type antimicrobial peptide transport system permease subunit